MIYIPDAAITAASRALAFLYGRAEGSVTLAALQEAIPHLGDVKTEYGLRYIDDKGTTQVAWVPSRKMAEMASSPDDIMMSRTVISTEWREVHDNHVQ